MSVIAKFRCDSVTDFGGRKNVVLHPVYEGSLPDDENTRFNRASPSGKLELTIDNPAAAIQFEPCAEYYLEFTKA